jgi:hypothetical protein
MAWYLAPSLAVLRAEVNARWPRRDMASDGTVGDAAHQATRSDHNPNSREAVDAWDMDKDGVDVDEVIGAFQKHPSSHYWIWQRQIASADDGWRRRPYTGDNPHTMHVHFSIRQSAAAEQDRRPWGLEEDVTAEQIKAAVVAGIHAALDQAATRSTPTGRQMGDDIAVLLHKQTGPLAAEVAALRSVVTQLAAAVEAGGGSVDTAAILAGVDAAVTAARVDLRDAVADLGEGGAVQVRAPQE